jgi:zinc transport system substrate-binding protein
VVFAGCHPKTEIPENIITVSILPQKYFIEKIAGNRFKVNVMIPPSASPATYDPSPAMIMQLHRSKMYLQIGYLGFEQAWMGNIAMANPQLKIKNVSKNIDLIYDHEHHGENNHEMRGIDPHTWMSVKNAGQMAYNFLEALIEADPDREEEFMANYHNFIVEIDTLDQFIEKKFKDIPSRKFLIYHPALSYFARDYRLEQVAIEKEGKSQSPSYIQEVIREATNEKISIIFVQKQFDIENAKAIAREINGSVSRIDPLDYDWERQIREMTEALANSMNP